MRHRTSLVAGITGPLAFILAWVIAGILRDGYDPITDAISRLAESGAPQRWIVTTGMIAFGLATLLFARGPAGETSPATRWFLVVAGFSSVAVAAFPCTAGCPGVGSTAVDTAHVIAAGVHYIALTNAPLSIWAAKRGEGGYPRFCLIVGGAAGIALLCQAVGVGPNGLMQRIGLTLNDVWMITTVVILSRRGLPTPGRQLRQR
jgi:hypothetical membrane protein